MWGTIMRTLILLAALIPFAGCSGTQKQPKSDPFVPRTRKARTVAQRRMYESSQPSKLGEGRAEIEGVVVR